MFVFQPSFHINWVSLLYESAGAPCPRDAVPYKKISAKILNLTAYL